MYTEKFLPCMDCGQEFPFPAEEQEFYQSKGFEEPKRCKPCRAARKANRQGGGGGFGGGGGGGRPREMFDVVCDGCGINTQVPFRPREDREVYCRDCLSRVRSTSR